MFVNGEPPEASAGSPAARGVRRRDEDEMQISNVVGRLRTTVAAASSGFNMARAGFTLVFRHDDSYAGIRGRRAAPGCAIGNLF